MLISEEALARYTEAGPDHAAGGRANPVDAVWTDRPPPPLAPALPHALAYAGRTAAEKRAGDRRGAARGEAGRGGAERPGLDRLAAEHPRRRRAVHAVRARLRAGPRRRAAPRCSWTPAKLPARDPRLAGQRRGGGRARGARPARWRGWPASGCGSIPPARRSGSPSALREAGATWRPGRTPACCRRPARTRSSSQGARNAHARDAVAVCRFLHWLDEVGPRGGATEMSAADKLLALRRRGGRLPRRELSRRSPAPASTARSSTTA